MSSLRSSWNYAMDGRGFQPTFAKPAESFKHYDEAKINLTSGLSALSRRDGDERSQVIASIIKTVCWLVQVGSPQHTQKTEVDPSLKSMNSARSLPKKMFKVGLGYRRFLNWRLRQSASSIVERFVKATPKRCCSFETTHLSLNNP